jgi:hypothetical protein
MSDLLHIGERLGSLTTLSALHSERLDSLEQQVNVINTKISLAARIWLVLVLWASGLSAALNSPDLGKQIAPLLKQAVALLLKSS